MQARYQGPYDIVKRSEPVNYVLSTPDRKKELMRVHVNLLKRYEGEVAGVAGAVLEDEEMHEEIVRQGREDFPLERAEVRLSNTKVLSCMRKKLQNLSEEQAKVERILRSFPAAMSDFPTQTSLLRHNVMLKEDVTPIKERPYRLPPEKRQRMKEEVKYLLDHGLAVPSQSSWASHCLLVAKEGGAFRLCTDYRKLNQVTVADSYPLPRIEDLIDEVSGATYLTKIDFSKDFIKYIPLTEEARRASAFVTPDSLYEYTVMPFGMRNSGSTFQRLANWIVTDLPDVRAYIDDIVIASKKWEEHMRSLEAVMKKLAEANLTVNLKKSEFATSTLTYLGHRVGRGAAQPLEAKIKDMIDFPAPVSRRSLRRFLDMATYYRRFIPNFVSVAAALTDMLSVKRKFKWLTDCEESFKTLKALLVSRPVLRAPDFNSDFIMCRCE